MRTPERTRNAAPMWTGLFSLRQFALAEIEGIFSRYHLPYFFLRVFYEEFFLAILGAIRESERLGDIAKHIGTRRERYVGVARVFRYVGEIFVFKISPCRAVGKFGQFGGGSEIVGEYECARPFLVNVANIFRASKDTSSLNPSTLARGKYLSKSVSSAESARPKNSGKPKAVAVFFNRQISLLPVSVYEFESCEGAVESRSSVEITTARGRDLYCISEPYHARVFDDLRIGFRAYFHKFKIAKIRLAFFYQVSCGGKYKLGEYFFLQ